MILLLGQWPRGMRVLASLRGLGVGAECEVGVGEEQCGVSSPGRVALADCKHPLDGRSIRLQWPSCPSDRGAENEGGRRRLHLQHQSQANHVRKV